MNIVLDGLSGVGKTHIGVKLAEALDMPFYEFLPDMENRNEVSLHAYTIQRQVKSYKTVIEGSYILSLLVKHYLHKVGLIDTKELLSIHSLSQKNINDCIIIYIEDSLDIIRERRAERGRGYEYTPEFGDLVYDLDEYISHNYFKVTNLPDNVVRIRYDRRGKEADEVVSDILELLPKVLFNNKFIK